ncbi:MAG TPA: hypothetical protein VGD86_01730 [Devosia sp.]
MPLPSFRAGLLAALIAFASPSIALAGASYFAPAQESASGAIAADPSGRLHAAHTGYDAPNRGRVYYRTCENDCAKAAAWQVLELAFEDPINVQVAVTQEGGPRLLVLNHTTGNGIARGYDYAACDSDCLDEDNWTITRVATLADRTFAGLFQYKIAERSFAVDASGQPHFIYVDANYFVEPDHYGAFYMTCLEDCSRAGNWIETDLAGHVPERYLTEQFDQTALAVTPDGQLRVIASVYPFDEAGNQLQQGLWYLQCDADCIDKANWSRARVIDTGSGSYPNPTWDIEVLDDGRPRIAFFAGQAMEQTDLDNQLIYMWCDAADCADEDAWNGNIVGWQKGAGESPDLEINGRGQPRIGVLSINADLAVVSCEDKCETSEGKWDAAYVEETTAAAADRPTAIPFHCDGEIWQGFMPRLALVGDTPWFAYDLVVEARCLYKELYDPDPRPTAVFHEIWRGSRVATIE